MNSVANLNREELLKRAKELEDLLDASKPKPPGKPAPPPTSGALKRSSTFPRNQFSLARTEQAQYFVTSNQQKTATSCRSVARAPLSHNRVFVRNKNRGKLAEKQALCDNSKANESNGVSRTESAASTATHSVGSKCVDNSLHSTNQADDGSPSGNLAISGRESQNETRDDWVRKHESLVFTIGDDESSEDDELIRSHHAALRNILHPVKPLISRGHQRKSVVYQSATKLVKINSSSMPKTLVRERLKLRTQPSVPNFSLRNSDVSKEHSSIVAGPSKEVNRIGVTSKHVEVPTNEDELAKSSLDSGQSSKSLKLAAPSSSSEVVTGNKTLGDGKSELKKPTILDRGISMSGSSFKQVLRRTRYKLLKGVTVSKKTPGPHNKVSKKRGTLKTNKKHLQTLLMLRGVPFQSSKDGKALKRINTSLSVKRVPTKTPLKTRFQAVASSVKRVASQLVNRSVYKLNKRKKSGVLSTVSSNSVSNLESKKDCIFFIRFGKCHKGNSCKFQHDPKKVSICTKFLRGTCKAEKCPFSHKVDKDRMPLCSYFQEGQCNATNCPYRHSYFRKDIPHCESFLRGFCEKGQQCPKKHVLVCINADCSRDPKICPLFHKTKPIAWTQKAGAGKTKKRKTLVVRQKTSVERDEAWPEFVTLSGSDDEVADVQMEMPSRTSENIKRFLERRTRPVWPDHSKGLSADPIDLRNLIRVNSQLRQTIRKARWLRKVRPIRIVGEFIPLHYVPEPAIIEQSVDRVKVKRRRKRKRRSQKSSICFSVRSGISSDESLSLVRTQKERLFETDDDEDFDPAYRTYGEALQRTKRPRASLGSAESVSSYTSPSDSSEGSLEGVEKDSNNLLKILPKNHRKASSSAAKRIAMNDDDEWLLDYLCHCDNVASPLPEPERLDFFGPVYEHWEFRTGDRIRETIEKFRSTFDPETSLAVMTTKLPVVKNVKSVSENQDFIPLRDHEEGEILTASEDEGGTASGDDLAVVDMELASDDETAMRAEEKQEEVALKEQSFDEPDGRIPLNDLEQSLQFVDDISDLEEGEVL